MRQSVYRIDAEYPDDAVSPVAEGDVSGDPRPRLEEDNELDCGDDGTCDEDGQHHRVFRHQI